MVRNKSQTFRTALILLFSIALVVVVTWFAPSLSAASLNMLFRLRGAFSAPADVVIVAIDDQSLQRIGQWPWPRSVMASALDRITEARPRSVGLDVIYAEPSASEEDRRLAAAIARNGRVVLPAQLYEKDNSASRATAWLRPLPEFASAARSLGHAHVSPEIDGMAQSIQLSKSDDQAGRLWAFGLEVVRAAEQIPVDDVEELPGLLRFGAYRIPVRDEAAGSTIPGVAIIRQNEMMINYAGPAGSFRCYSIADVIDDKVPGAAFNDKIVLIGAVAESMGDTRVAPFMHYSAEAGAGGREMPGVEIHANIINTLRNRLSFRALPDWAAFLAALAVILLSALTIKWFDGWSQILILALILLSIVLGSLFAFSHYLIIPPLAAMLTGFVAVIPLMLNRSLAASRELDIKLAALVSSQKGFLPADNQAESDFINGRLALDLPQSLAWKLQAVDDLTTRLLARMSFIDRILTSMDEGVLVTDLEGRIVFVNREATQLFGYGENELVGAIFADFLIERGALDPLQLREAIKGVAGGRSAQIEFEIQGLEPRYYSLLLSALTLGAQASPLGAQASPLGAQASPLGAQASLPARPGDSPIDFQCASPSIEQSDNLATPGSNVIGVVALLADITKRVELDRMKTETLQLVSHELRTPLTSIQGLSDVLIKFPVAADESNEMLRTIRSEAVRLGEMINRYLDLTRLESGAQPLHLTPVSCQELIAGCIRRLSIFATERKIKLTSKVKPSVPILQADAQLLAQAVNNLLSNAIKYSPPETEIVVAAELNHSNVVISVRDQGFGIPEEARERIFEKFYRLERDTTSSIIGAGLGLPLVKEIVERHGGWVTVESDPATGSTFTIFLPLRQQALSATLR